MPSTYTSNNKIQKIATGEQSGTWGNTTNTNFDLFDTAIDGFVAVALTGTTHTLNIPDGTAADGRNKVISFTGTLAAANTVSITPNTVKKHYFVQNNTTGGQNVIISQGSGSTVTIKPGYSSIVYLDGAGSGGAVKEVLTSLKLTALLEATGVVFVGSSSGNTTLQANATASGTLTLPAATDTLVGKATTDTLTNKTFDTAGAGNVLRINGTQVSAVTGSGSVVLATSPTLVTPLLGTPTSGTLTNCTGLPISSGVSGLGTNVATFLATPSSANLASAVTDETGSGALVFGTSPTIATPTITTSATVPLVIGGTGTTSSLTLRSTSGVGTTGADIVFQTGNNGATEVMRLQNGGNVLVGTTSSGFNAAGLPLVVGSGSGNNGITIFSGSTTSGSIHFADTVTTGVGSYSGYINYNHNVNSMQFATDALERMRIDSSGNVGIGTSSPQRPLDVRKAGTAGNTLILQTLFNTESSYQVNSGSGLLFQYGGGQAQAMISGNIESNGSGANGYLSLCTTTDGGATLPERMRITAGGNVGIGTSSPQRPLDVRKAGTAGNTLILQTLFNTESSYQVNSGSGLLFQYGGGQAQAMISGNIESNGSGANGYLSLCTTTDSGATLPERMRITAGGNVGIGTASPAYQLQLSSDSAAKPTTNTWTIASDARLKAVKGEYQKGLAEICQVRPVSYEYNGKAGFIADGKDKVSILAQELMQVFPECVDTFKGKLEEDGPEIDLYNYNGHAITFALINAIKELKAKIDILEARN